MNFCVSMHFIFFFDFLQFPNTLKQVYLEPQMVLHLNKAIWGSRYTCFSVFGNWRKSKKKKIKCIEKQKFIYSVKLHILHQMKPYSRVKTSWDPTYACIIIFVELRQVKDPNVPNHGHQYTESHPKCQTPHFTLN